VARLTKAERQVQAQQNRERRERFWEERQSTRFRFGIGFAGAYVAEKLAVSMLPSLTPAPDSPLNAVGGIVDLGLAAGGGYLAATDRGEVGDYATGAAAVGATQFLDRVVGALQGVLNRPANGA
jgi:ornithine cyclodeaminase/alanine dehydrogenase-like protein (mu-crystallin family)